MSWRPDSSRSYNNIGSAPSFITETECMSQQAMLFEKEFFSGACYTCGAMPSVTGVRVQRCAGCQLVSYCNKNCQAANWKIHKIVCKKFPVEMGKNIIVRKTESVGSDLKSFLAAMWELQVLVFESRDSLKQFTRGVGNLFVTPRACGVCHEARNEKLFDCRCCAASYCSESHRKMDTKHWRSDCDLLYGCAMANWYLIQHHHLQIPEGLLNEVNLNYGLKFEKVSKLTKYSSEKWLEAIVNLINERLTFPLTIHHALKNLELGKQKKALSEITSLTIHIVHFVPMLDPRIWEFILHQLPNLKILNLTFINWTMKLDTTYNSFLPIERCSDCKRKQRVVHYNIQPMHYHEYFSSDDYIQPDVVAVFGTAQELESGEMHMGENNDKAQRFTSQGNMTYSKHTVVILTDGHEEYLESSMKSFHDARPVNVLLPVQKNPAAEFTTSRGDNAIVNQNVYFCCIQRNH